MEVSPGGTRPPRGALSENRLRSGDRRRSRNDIAETLRDPFLGFLIRPTVGYPPGLYFSRPGSLRKRRDRFRQAGRRSCGWRAFLALSEN